MFGVKILFKYKFLIQNYTHWLLDGTDPSAIPKGLYINCHHFSISLSELRKYNPNVGMGTPLTMSQAIAICELDFGRNRFTEYTNSIFFFFYKKLHMKYRTDHWLENFHKYKTLYAHSPTTTRNDISSYITSLRKNITRTVLPFTHIVLNTQSYHYPDTCH